jgi:flavorubredoxin
MFKQTLQPFEAIKISEHVYWVGAVDHELRNFHGYNTTHGSTYNAYLITTDEPILIETVKAPFFEEMLARIRSVMPVEKIKYLISNHAEMDHSGSLPLLLKLIKPKKIFTSKIGIQTLKAHFHFDADLQAISNNEIFSLGSAQFKCFETKMLHWPESMMTYFCNDKILFSQDGFGMHAAISHLFSDQNCRDLLLYEATKYFANILLPYAPMVTKLFEQLPSLNLDIQLLAPAHGPIWNNAKDIEWILSLWKQWAQQQPSPKIVIAYDSMWGSTTQMAHAIAAGCAQIPEIKTISTMPLEGSSRSEVVTKLLEAGALLIGSPTLNQQVLPTVADLLCYLKGLKPKNLIGQAFGSYGWSPAAIKIIQQDLQAMDVELVSNPIMINYVPTTDDLNQCKNFGLEIAQELMKRLK